MAYISDTINSSCAWTVDTKKSQYTIIAQIFLFISGFEGIYTTDSKPKKNFSILTTFSRNEFSKFMAQKKVEHRKKIHGDQILCPGQKPF